MKAQEFLEFKKQLDLEAFKQFAYYHSDSEIVTEYGISHGNLRELRKEFNIYTPKDIINKKRKGTWDNKAIENTSKLQQKVDKDSLYQYYEVENHRWEEVLNHFSITNSELIKLLKVYNIHKSTDAHIAQIKATKLAKYGDENYNNRAKAIDTCLERYNVENVSQLDWVLEAMQNTWKEHGFDHPMHVDEYKQKVIDSGKLYNNDSKPNRQFAQLLEENCITYTKEFVLNNFRYDFKVGNILIEINPTAFHNVIWNPFGDPIKENYHRNKSLNALNNGYRCIHVWDWDNYANIIKLLIPMERVYARKCIIKEVEKKEAKEFINLNHLQGYTIDEIRLGLYYDNELVSIITFGKPRYNKNFEFELLRYCSNKHVVGGAEKLFKYFIDNYKPASIISYCDFSKFSGETYTKLGFSKASEVPALGIHWYKNGHHVLNNTLRQQGADRIFGTSYGKGTSNTQIAIEQGYSKICDAGQFRFEWHKEYQNNC